MVKKLRNKKGNEILQTLVIVAIIGALAITVCVLISSKLRKTSEDNLIEVGNGIGSSVNEFKFDSTNTEAIKTNLLK